MLDPKLGFEVLVSIYLNFFQAHGLPIRLLQADTTCMYQKYTEVSEVIGVPQIIQVMRSY